MLLDADKPLPVESAPSKTSRQWLKPVAIVFLVALALRLTTFALWLPKMKPDVDLDYYRSLARSVAAGNGFVAVDTDGQEHPTVARTPVYPLFLRGLMKLGGDSLGLFLFAQCVLGAVTCALVVVLAARWLSWSSAVVAGLLCAIDINLVQLCMDLRTETLFNLLLVAGACFLARCTRARPAWIIAGALWGLGALCRPIAVWLWAVAAVVAVVGISEWRPRLSAIALFLAGFLPLIALWAARNAALTGHVFVSTVSTRNLLRDWGAGIEAERRGQDIETVRNELIAQYGDLEFFRDRESFERTYSQFSQKATELIAASPILAAKHFVVGSAKVLIGPGARRIELSFREPSPPPRIWPRVYSAALAAAILLAVFGVAQLRSNAVLLVALAVYFTVLASGPVGYGRYRAPLTPMLAILAVAAVVKPRKPGPSPENSAL